MPRRPRQHGTCPVALICSTTAPNAKANDLALWRALELASVEFIDENGGGPGVRLRSRQWPKHPNRCHIGFCALRG
jgi:hypothetical protein